VSSSYLFGLSNSIIAKFWGKFTQQIAIKQIFHLKKTEILGKMPKKA
jgi:hypothetical protein